MPQIAGYYRPTHSHLVFTFASICFNICAFVADGDWRLDFGMCVMASGTCCSLWCFWSCPYPLLIRAFCPCLSADYVPYPAVSGRILPYPGVFCHILAYPVYELSARRQPGAAVTRALNSFTKHARSSPSA